MITIVNNPMKKTLFIQMKLHKLSSSVWFHSTKIVTQNLNGKLTLHNNSRVRCTHTHKMFE